MINYIRNLCYNYNRYRSHPEAVIIACYFNSENSPYRLKAFNQFYDTIKHLNHYIIECGIGGKKQELTGVNKDSYRFIATDNLLWHKEALLNTAVDNLPSKYKYVFWLDADIRFTNLNWMVDSVKEFKRGANILQPFEYCVHLNKDETTPSFDVEKLISCYERREQRSVTNDTTMLTVAKIWRSFCANCVNNERAANSTDYNTHGHVGFAWAAKREVITKVRLYDRALIGGADHIIAHAAAGQIPCNCINKSFTGDLDSVYEWSKRFAAVVKKRIAYVKGNLYHTWHGDIERRQYLKRIQEFTPATKQITEKDKNGLYVNKGDNKYVEKYFKHREVSSSGYHHDHVGVHHSHHYHSPVVSKGSSVSLGNSAGYNDASETFS